MSVLSLVSRQGLRLGIILLVCAGLTVVTSTFLQTPMGTAALSTVVRRGGPEGAFQGPPPNAGAGPREGGSRLAPTFRAGLPELLRSAGTMGLFTVVVAVLLRRKPRPQPARARLGVTARPAKT